MRMGAAWIALVCSVGLVVRSLESRPYGDWLDACVSRCAAQSDICLRGSIGKAAIDCRTDAIRCRIDCHIIRSAADSSGPDATTWVRWAMPFIVEVLGIATRGYR